MADKVIEELRRIKETMVQYGYDVTRHAADLRCRQQEKAPRIVDLRALRGADDQEESAGSDS